MVKLQYYSIYDCLLSLQLNLALPVNQIVKATSHYFAKLQWPLNKIKKKRMEMEVKMFLLYRVLDKYQEIIVGGDCWDVLCGNKKLTSTPVSCIEVAIYL